MGRNFKILIVTFCISNVLSIASFGSRCQSALLGHDWSQGLSVMTLNAQNLFPSDQRVIRNSYFKDKQERLAHLIRTHRPQIIFIQETRDSHLWADAYLDEAYQVYESQVNDPKDKRVSFLVTKDCPLRVDFETLTEGFWRGVGVLQLYLNDSKTPVMSFFGVHLKSKYQRPGEENDATIRRRELEALVQVIENRRQDRRRSWTPIVLGDFNTDINQDVDVQHLLNRLELVNPLREADRKERATHQYVAPDGRVYFQQLDGILLPANRETMVKESSVVNHFDPEFQEYPQWPHLSGEHKSWPSDHRAVVMRLKF